jgi:hypothetical protein
MPARVHHLRTRVLPSAGSVQQRLRLLVVETGASPLRGEGSDEFDETLAIAQMRDEQPEAFAQRTLDRLASVERSGRHYASAVLLTGPRHDDAARVARRRIALGLAAHGSAHGDSCELRFESDRGVSEQAQVGLLELVEELMADREHGAIPVSLRFGDSSQTSRELKSGTFFSVPQ